LFFLALKRRAETSGFLRRAALAERPFGRSARVKAAPRWYQMPSNPYQQLEQDTRLGEST